MAQDTLTNESNVHMPHLYNHSMNFLESNPQISAADYFNSMYMGWAQQNASTNRYSPADEASLFHQYQNHYANPAAYNLPSTRGGVVADSAGQGFLDGRESHHENHSSGSPTSDESRYSPPGYAFGGSHAADGRGGNELDMTSSTTTTDAGVASPESVHGDTRVSVASPDVKPRMAVEAIHPWLTASHVGGLAAKVEDDRNAQRYQPDDPSNIRAYQVGHLPPNWYGAASAQAPLSPPQTAADANSEQHRADASQRPEQHRTQQLASTLENECSPKPLSINDQSTEAPETLDVKSPGGLIWAQTENNSTPSPSPPPLEPGEIVRNPPAPEKKSTNKKKKKTDPSHVPRPMNAFMVWSKTRRQSISQEYPKLHNSEISKILGTEWKSMNETEKHPFKERAKEISAKHKEANPGYRYQPKRKPKKAMATSDSTVLNQFHAPFATGNFDDMGSFRPAAAAAAGQAWPQGYSWNPPVAAAAVAYNQTAQKTSPFSASAYNHMAAAKSYNTAIAMANKHVSAAATHVYGNAWEVAAAAATAAARNHGLYNGNNHDSAAQSVTTSPTGSWNESSMAQAAQVAQARMTFPYLGGYQTQASNEDQARM